MDNIELKNIASNGIRLRIADGGGDGPLVLMLHGFPESWYSWRHQIPALKEAGYRPVAVDMRGYGGSDKPDEISAYDQVTIAADVAGLVPALGHDDAVVVGHDWGGPAAWTSALLYPDIFRAVAVLSVPYRPRGAFSPLAGLRKIYEGRYFYMLYFQEPGVAEAELETDVRQSIKLFVCGISGEAPPGAFPTEKAPGDPVLQGMTEPGELPDWLSDADLDYFAEQFKAGGFRGPLNWYRNLDRTWERLAAYEGAKIEQPALFMAGDKDPVIYFTPDGLDVMRASVPNLRDCIILPGCGHWTQQERPDAVNGALLKFLDGL